MDVEGLGALHTAQITSCLFAWPKLGDTRQLGRHVQVPDAELVRDVLYVCQGLNGHHIKYRTTAEGGLGAYQVDPTAGIPSPQRQLLARLCELGWLYRCWLCRRFPSRSFPRLSIPDPLFPPPLSSSLCVKEVTHVCVKHN